MPTPGFKVQVSTATAQSCDPFSEFVCEVGRHPIPMREIDGKREFRPSQTVAFNTLFDPFPVARTARRKLSGRCPLLTILNAPPAAGKSTVQKGLAFVYARRGERTVIAVPDTMISGSFRSEFDIQYILPDGTTMEWAIPPENFLFFDPSSIEAEEGAVKRLVDFVKGRNPPTPELRVMVCTHAALVRAHQQLVAEFGREAWKGVNVFLDEGHHSKFRDGDDDAEEAREVQVRRRKCNELGKLVRHYVENLPGRVMVTTATLLRGDAATIIGASRLQHFVEYELPMHEYLDSLTHLKEIVFKFSVADTYEETLHTEIGRAPHMRTLAYQPVVKRGEGQIKLNRLARFQRALGPSRANGDGFSRSHTFSEGTEVVTVDMVTPDGRDEARRLFEDNKDTPHVIFVQNLFREGADWRQAERSLVFGARSSLPMLIQMIGRLLRDYCPHGVTCPGCADGKRRVEFHIVLPKNITADFDQFETYTGTIFTVMALGWLFQSRFVSPELRTQRMIERIKARCHDVTMRGTKKPAGETMRDILREAISAAGAKADEGEVEGAAKTLTSCLTSAFRLAFSAIRDLIDPPTAETMAKAIDENPFNAAGVVYETQWGAEAFRKFRESYVGLPEVTEVYVARLVALHRCKQFQAMGQYVDPRTIEGLVELWGSAEALDAACTAEGL